MKIIILILILMGSALSAWANGPTNVLGKDIWRQEFMGHNNDVAVENWSFVPDVRICGGLPKGEAKLAVLMTAIHHDAVGKRPATGRLAYTRLSLAGERMLQRAEWIKGEPLTESEKDALGRLYQRYSGAHRDVGYFQAPKGSTMFAGQALLMNDAVFGRNFDIAGGVRKLEEKNGWRMDVERCESPTADWLRRAINKDCVPILESRNHAWGKEKMELALGITTNASGMVVICVDPMECGVGQQSRFERYGGDPWDKLLAPPGSSSWNGREFDKRDMRPDDVKFKINSELPPGSRVVSYVPGDWVATVVKEMRPAWSSWQAEIARIVVTNKPVKATQGGDGSEDVARWIHYFSGRETFAISAPCDLISNIQCCPEGKGVNTFATAMSTVIFRSFPEGLALVQTGHDWRRTVQYTCEERWRTMSEKEQKDLYGRFREIACNLAMTQEDIDYDNGVRLWSVDEEGGKKLRAIFAEATNGVTMDPVKLSPGRTQYQEAISRLGPFEDSPDPVGVVMKRITDRYGWTARVEKSEKPSFAVLKKAIEMEIPVLVEKPGSRGWMVIVGFLSEGAVNYVLVVEPEAVQAEPRVETASDEEHCERLALADGIPGRVKYEKEAAKSLFRADRLLDTRRGLPPGCRFVKVDKEASLGTAYFIHDWRPLVCFKDKIDDLLKNSKPGDIPPPPKWKKSWNVFK